MRIVFSSAQLDFSSARMNFSLRADKVFGCADHFFICTDGLFLRADGIFIAANKTRAGDRICRVGIAEIPGGAGEGCLGTVGIPLDTKGCPLGAMAGFSGAGKDSTGAGAFPIRDCGSLPDAAPRPKERRISSACFGRVLAGVGTVGDFTNGDCVLSSGMIENESPRSAMSSVASVAMSLLSGVILVAPGTLSAATDTGDRNPPPPDPGPGSSEDGGKAKEG